MVVVGGSRPQGQEDKFDQVDKKPLILQLVQFVALRLC